MEGQQKRVDGFQVSGDLGEVVQLSELKKSNSG